MFKPPLTTRQPIVATKRTRRHQNKHPLNQHQRRHNQPRNRANSDSFELTRAELRDPGVQAALSEPGAIKGGYLLLTPLTHEAT